MSKALWDLQGKLLQSLKFIIISKNKHNYSIILSKFKLSKPFDISLIAYLSFGSYKQSLKL